MIAGLAQKLIRRLAAYLRGPPPITPRAPRRRLELSADPSTIYAIGDVHGCLDHLLRLEQKIVADALDRRGPKLIVMLGDYLDRGPDSAGVISHLLSPPPAGFYRVCLSGNHEEALLDVLEGRSDLDAWLGFGGEQTMRSYGIDVYYLRHELGFDSDRIAEELFRGMPESHRTFLAALPVTLSTPRYFFVHAGARPGIPLADQDEHDLMWIRTSFLALSCPPFEKIVVHGHTPSAQPVLLPHRLGIDTGAYMGGALTAIRLADSGAAILTAR